MPKKASSSTPESEKEVKTTKKTATKKTTDAMGEKKTTRKKATVSDSGDTAAPVKKPRKKSAKSAAAEAASQVVLKAYWGGFNPQMVQIAQYEYFQQEEAQKSADDLTEKKKAPHFIQLIKKIV